MGKDKLLVPHRSGADKVVTDKVFASPLCRVVGVGWGISGGRFVSYCGRWNSQTGRCLRDLGFKPHCFKPSTVKPVVNAKGKFRGNCRSFLAETDRARKTTYLRILDSTHMANTPADISYLDATTNRSVSTTYLAGIPPMSRVTNHMKSPTRQVLPSCEPKCPALTPTRSLETTMHILPRLFKPPLRPWDILISCPEPAIRVFVPRNDYWILRLPTFLDLLSE